MLSCQLLPIGAPENTPMCCSGVHHCGQTTYLVISFGGLVRNRLIRMQFLGILGRRKHEPAAWEEQHNCFTCSGPYQMVYSTSDNGRRIWAIRQCSYVVCLSSTWSGWPWTAAGQSVYAAVAYTDVAMTRCSPPGGGRLQGEGREKMTMIVPTRRAPWAPDFHHTRFPTMQGAAPISCHLESPFSLQAHLFSPRGVF